MMLVITHKWVDREHPDKVEVDSLSPPVRWRNGGGYGSVDELQKSRREFYRGHPRLVSIENTPRGVRIVTRPEAGVPTYGYSPEVTYVELHDA